MVGDQCKHDTTGSDFLNFICSYKSSFKQHHYKRYRYNILTYSYSVIPAASPHTHRIVSLTVNNWIIMLRPRVVSGWCGRNQLKWGGGGISKSNPVK